MPVSRFVVAMSLFVSAQVLSATVLVAASVDQSDLAVSTGYDISGEVSADDFVLSSTILLTSAEVWLADTTANDNGSLDDFSGALSWALYSDSAGSPGTELAKGNAVGIVQTDTNIQSGWHSDIVKVTFDLDHPVLLAAGTYWLAIHENAWHSAYDGSIVWWMDKRNLEGADVHTAATTPAGWTDPFPEDLSFALYGSPTLWASGTYAPANSGSEISAYVTASDFAYAKTTTISTIDAWLWDDGAAANGTFDGFSGTLSWAIYQDSSGKPGALIAHGDDTSPQLALIDTHSTFDIARARIAMGRSLTLAPGTYWLALHEGTWSSAYDGTPIYWAAANTQFGNPTV